jgi:hypothetical protein
MESKYGDDDGQPSSFSPLSPFVNTTLLKIWLTRRRRHRMRRQHERRNPEKRLTLPHRMIKEPTR